MRIRAVAKAFPSRCVENSEIARWAGIEEAFLEEKVGVHNRFFLDSEENGISLAEEACSNLINNNKEFQRNKLGMLLFVTQNPDLRIPHSSAILQDRLGLPTDLACMDIGLGCSGYVYSLAMAKAFMMAEDISDGLVITCDPYSRIMKKSDKNTISIFGDAATASWLSATHGAVIGKGVFGTDGSGGRHLTLNMANRKLLERQEGSHAEGIVSLGVEKFLTMNGRAIFNFMHKRVPESVYNCLKTNGLTIDDVDYFVFHQASKFLLENLVHVMKLDPNKVPIDLESTGNTVSSSIPLILEGLINSKNLKGKIVLCSGFGVGLSWATNILFF